MKFLCQPLQKFQPEQVKVYHHTKNEVSIATASKVIVQTDRQTDRHIDTTKTLLLSRTRR